MERRQARGGSVMLRAMFCRETLGSGIHVNVTLMHTTSLIYFYFHNVSCECLLYCVFACVCF